MKKLICLVALLFVGTANATLIDFEELSYGQTVAHDLYAADGIVFDSSINWKIYDLTSYPKVLYNATNFGGDLMGSFTNEVSDLSILMGDIGGDFDTGRLEVYDAAGNLLATDYDEGNSWFTVSVDTNSIASFRVFATGYVSYDEIEFDANAISEPAILALLGLGLIGMAYTRKK